MLISALNRRGAVKYFDEHAILSEALIETVLEAGRLAPSAFGLQPYRAVVITDKQKREKIAEHCFNQPQITQASALIIGQVWQQITPEDIESYMLDIVQQRGATREELEPFYQTLSQSFLNRSAEDLTNWATRQAYISLGMMLTAAAVENIGSSPMEGFNPSALDNALETPEKYRSVFLLALGYRSASDERSRWPRVRKPKEQWIVRLD